MEKKLRMTLEQVLEQARLAVRYAKKASEPDFLCRVLEAAIKDLARCAHRLDVAT
jgi:2-isopropylmalate synthase